MQIKRIGPRSLGKLLGFMYAVIGLIIGAVISIFALMEGDADTGRIHAFGIAAIVALPIFYGLIGLVGGYVSAWIYNFIAKRVGGIEIETE